MNCSNCGAPLKVAGPGSYLYCRHCSSLFFPTETRDGVEVVGIESELHCPVCADTLVAASVGEAHILYCRRCHGMLLRQDVFAYVVPYLRARAPEEPALPRPINKGDLQRDLHCPQCRRLMDTHPYYGPGAVVIDICMPCRQVWLDGRELDAIVNAPGVDWGSGPVPSP